MAWEWYYNSSDFKTKQDILDEFNEINAYSKLDGEDFDFGTGLIINEMSLGSEDAYYEMDLQSLEEALEYWDYKRPVEKKKKKHKPTKRYFAEKEKRDLKRLHEISPESVWDRDNWLKRGYRGSRSAHLKKVSNKKVRRYKGELSKKGTDYRKVYDYWYILY